MIAYVSDLQRCHGDGNDRLKRLVDEDGLVKRIVDLCETKAQVEVNGEALRVAKDLDVEEGGAAAGEATSGESPRRRDAEASRDSTRVWHRCSYSAWRTSKSR